MREGDLLKRREGTWPYPAERIAEWLVHFHSNNCTEMRPLAKTNTVQPDPSLIIKTQFLSPS